MLFPVFFALFLFPSVAYAYIAPGLGLGTVALVVGGVIFSIVLGLLALFWYPIKRMRKKGSWGRFSKWYFVFSLLVIATLSAIVVTTFDSKQCAALLEALKEDIVVAGNIRPTGHITKDSPRLFPMKSQRFKRKVKARTVPSGTLQPVDPGLDQSLHSAQERPSLAMEPITHSYYKDKYLLITSMFNGRNAMRLIDSDGRLVNEWVFKPKDAAIHDRGRWGIDLHGSTVLPDGSAMANFEYKAVLRVDRCSKPIMYFPKKDQRRKITRAIHHVIEPTPRGTFWVLGQVLYKKPVKTFKPPVADDLLIEIDANGKVIQSHSVLEIFLRSDLQALLINDELVAPIPNALMHVNDIEELRPEMAAAFPLFEAGDLMISLRSINTIAVIDRQSFTIKWHYRGSFIHQHDPDFQPDGTISLFDNRNDAAKGTLYGGSRILRIDPVTRKETVIYSDGADFFSQIRGKHTILEDGNILITEFSRGRVFMVNPQGQILFQYVNPTKYGDVAKGVPRYYEITKAEFIPKEYFTQSPRCPDKKGK